MRIERMYRDSSWVYQGLGNSDFFQWTPGRLADSSSCLCLLAAFTFVGSFCYFYRGSEKREFGAAQRPNAAFTLINWRAAGNWHNWRGKGAWAWEVQSLLLI